MAKISIILEYLMEPIHIHGALYTFRVVRVKNSLAPMAGALMTNADAQSLIDQGMEVIIDPEGRKSPARKEGTK